VRGCHDVSPIPRRELMATHPSSSSHPPRTPEVIAKRVPTLDVKTYLVSREGTSARFACVPAASDEGAKPSPQPLIDVGPFGSCHAIGDVSASALRALSVERASALGAL
jgi:hypothetical protein